MGVVGFQEFLQVGGRMFFKRDPIDGVEQPLVDFGVLQSVKPTVAPQSVEVFDPDGGVKRRVDKSTTQIDESWEAQCSNFNMDNMAVLMLSAPPVEFTVAVAHKRVSSYLHAGRLKELRDSDAAATRLYGLGAIAGVISAAVSAGVLSTAVLTAITPGTKTLTITGDITLGLTAGESIVVEGTGLANIANARTYTVVSFSFGGGNTSIVVAETPAAAEVAIAGSIIYKAAADSGTVYAQDVDWEILSLDRGIIRVKQGGAISTDGAKVVVFSTAAISGKRRISPQSVSGDIQGKAEIWIGAGNNAHQWVREARVSIVPNTTELSADNFSTFTITVAILSAVTQTDAGTFTKVKGALPSSS